MVEDFNDTSQEWRRLFSELLGTFFLVLVAAGGGMMGQAFPFPDTVGRTAAVTALVQLGHHCRSSPPAPNFAERDRRRRPEPNENVRPCFHGPARMRDHRSLVD